jgi:uroporphyrinogen-III decarboxylase
VEESKKGFELSIPTIRERLAGRLSLFGNVDSLVLLHDGSPEDVRRAVAAQARGAGPGFVTANGSPITPGTPPANVDALIAAGKALPGTGGTGGPG